MMCCIGERSGQKREREGRGGNVFLFFSWCGVAVYNPKPLKQDVALYWIAELSRFFVGHFLWGSGVGCHPIGMTRFYPSNRLQVVLRQMSLTANGGEYTAYRHV